MQDTNVPPEDHRIKDLRPVESITKSATYVARTLVFGMFIQQVSLQKIAQEHKRIQIQEQKKQLTLQQR